ncbi:MAG: carbohydrate ABC transporter permease [Chloroflexota bacterium]|nr:carbohydrate ABC transporter permease [Chloroflexota bacterium]
MSAARFSGQESRQRGIHWRHVLVSLFNHAILILFTVIIVYPVLWMILASFKTPGELISNIWGLPAEPALQNYTDAWEKARLGRALLNSGIVSIGAVLVVVCLSSIAGYAFAKFSFRFSGVILLVFVFTMQAPVPIIPFYVLFVRLKLTDSYLGLILAIASGAIPLSIFIFQAFFRSIPNELREAAKIDGCSEFTAFLRVVMPISGPAVATVSILTFVGAWNEYFLPLLLIRSDELRPLTLTIQVFFLQFGRAEWNVIFATLSIASIPMIVIYVLLQRWFIRGLTSGSIKG